MNDLTKSMIIVSGENLAELFPSASDGDWKCPADLRGT